MSIEINIKTYWDNDESGNRKRYKLYYTVDSSLFSHLPTSLDKTNLDKAIQAVTQKAIKSLENKDIRSLNESDYAAIDHSITSALQQVQLAATEEFFKVTPPPSDLHTPLVSAYSDLLDSLAQQHLLAPKYAKWTTITDVVEKSAAFYRYFQKQGATLDKAGQLALFNTLSADFATHLNTHPELLIALTPSKWGLLLKTLGSVHPTHPKDAMGVWKLIHPQLKNVSNLIENLAFLLEGDRAGEVIDHALRSTLQAKAAPTPISDNEEALFTTLSTPPSSGAAQTQVVFLQYLYDFLSHNLPESSPSEEPQILFNQALEELPSAPDNWIAPLPLPIDLNPAPSIKEGLEALGPDLSRGCYALKWIDDNHTVHTVSIHDLEKHLKSLKEKDQLIALAFLNQRTLLQLASKFTEIGKTTREGSLTGYNFTVIHQLNPAKITILLEANFMVVENPNTEKSFALPLSYNEGQQIHMILDIGATSVLKIKRVNYNLSTFGPEDTYYSLSNLQSSPKGLSTLHLL